MIKEVIKQWDDRKSNLEKWFTENKCPGTYGVIFKKIFELVVIDALGRGGEWSETWDTENIVTIDHGHYQGTEIFIIHRDTYQPDINDYYFSNTYYGSCSGCDTLGAIRSDGDYDSKCNESQVKDLMTLALHLIQKLKPMTKED